MRVKEIMSSPVITAGPDTHPKEIAALLLRHGISAAPVVDAAGDLLGIVSEADLIPFETVPDPRSQARPLDRPGHEVPRSVTEIMTQEVVTLPEQADVAQAARLMLERGVKRIPIVAGRRVVGLVSRHDLLKVLARGDADIAAELDRLLQEDVLLGGRFAVEVTDGQVTLSGPDDPRDRRLAEVLARSVPGVLDVVFTPRPGGAP